MANLLAVGGGSWMVVHGSMTLGQLTSFIMYLGLMIWPMLAMAWMFNIVERGSAAYVRVQALLAEEPDVPDGHLDLPAERGVLDVNVQCFAYPEGKSPRCKRCNCKSNRARCWGFVARPARAKVRCWP
ncbi:hypothetical protein PCI56_24175 [Plesiomonas shigelloides subsp. oncorhynchi]|nr:hypothetical protein [Plesiomonas shigelloides]